MTPMKLVLFSKDFLNDGIEDFVEERTFDLSGNVLTYLRDGDSETGGLMGYSTILNRIP